MPNDEVGGMGQNGNEEHPETSSNLCPNQSSQRDSPLQSGEQRGGPGETSQASHMGGAVHLPTLGIVISQPEEIPSPRISISKKAASEGDERFGVVAAATAATSTKAFVPSESYKDQCRVCQQQTEEPLIDLGCSCRGELAKVHSSCIEIWFRTKGSNICEICQQIAANVPFPEPQTSTNYWVWRLNSARGRGQQENGRGRLNPLWVAFALLIGGLLLDVLISVSLGISSLPVNIITVQCCRSSHCAGTGCFSAAFSGVPSRVGFTKKYSGRSKYKSSLPSCSIAVVVKNREKGTRNTDFATFYLLVPHKYLTPR